MSPEEFDHWHQDLGHFPILAIEWAFENWRRSGRFFPAYGDILDQCIAWEPSPASVYSPGCSAECKARHGKGYSGVDMKRIFDMYIEKSNEVRRKPSNKEIMEMFDKLDKIRGGSPEWRRKA